MIHGVMCGAGEWCWMMSAAAADRGRRVVVAIRGSFGTEVSDVDVSAGMVVQ
jgi:hypothetical protein